MLHIRPLSVMQTSETSEKIVLRKSPAYHINNLLNTQSARLSGDVCGARLCASNAYLISDQERKWRDAILKYDFNEMSRLLSNDPELVNWRDYITGVSIFYLLLVLDTNLFFFLSTLTLQSVNPCVPELNDMSLVRLLAGTYKANVDIRNHGLTPLHMAAIGASEEVAFTLMSQFNAKATVRDYSGRLPFNYLPDTEAGNRLKSKLKVLQ
ncbi:ank repeat-containing [Echinococcus granulosus]|uniref:Ank repeat-containing n=1 Tax=Echinococcus granulosus TaxID=6210 RepID=W6UKG4_ECHGR|nr:ank repeat-containing [Echinococcus granulosus]EUB61568.1 ank repeat-containing [Echinococcus granulosus]